MFHFQLGVLQFQPTHELAALRKDWKNQIDAIAVLLSFSLASTEVFVFQLLLSRLQSCTFPERATHQSALLSFIWTKRQPLGLIVLINKQVSCASCL